MHPPTKDHVNGIGKDEPTLDASEGATIETPEGDIYENRDMARQEFGQEADVNYMLSRLGITPERGAPVYGEWDDTIDLQQALTSVAEAKIAYADLPEPIRKKFNSMEELLTAYNNGSFQIVDGEVPIPPKTETEILQERIKDLEARLPQTDPT